MLSPFLSVPDPCEETADRLQRRLVQDGFRALQTFDLQDARLGLDDCPCPHHGTTECDCQMIVVLVYGNKPEPATLILHGHDGQTWISLAEQAEQTTDSNLVRAVRSALEDNSSALSGQAA